MKFEINKNLFFVNDGYIGVSEDETLIKGDVAFRIGHNTIKAIREDNNLFSCGWRKILFVTPNINLDVPLLVIENYTSTYIKPIFYTEEDVKKAISLAKEMTWDDVSHKAYAKLKYSTSEILKKLNEPKQIQSIELESEYKDMKGCWYKVDDNSRLAIERFVLEERLKISNNKVIVKNIEYDRK